MKIMAVANQKGGCGKTTTAVNIASALARMGKKTLFIDTDPQTHATSAWGIESQKNIGTTNIFSAYLEEKELDLKKIIIKRSDFLDIIPSNVSLVTIEQHKNENKLDILFKFLKYHNFSYDYVIIDCAPNLGILTINALMASDYILSPIEMSTFSLHGLDYMREIINMVGNFKGHYPLSFFLITQFDKRSNFAKEFLKNAKEKLGIYLLNTVIRNNVYLREAAAKGKSIFEHNPKSNGAIDYEKAVNELLNNIKNISWAEFTVETKNVNEIYVVGDFTGWKKKNDFKLAKLSDDFWFLRLPLKKGQYRYKFVTENNKWFNDIKNPHYEKDNFGGYNSILYIE